MPRRGWRHQGPVHLPRDIALQAPHRLSLALALGRAPRYVFGGSRVAAHPAYDDAVQRPVGPAVAAPVEPVPARLAAGRLDRAGPAQHRERRLGAHAPGIVARRDSELGRAQGPASVDLEHGRRVLANYPPYGGFELLGP